MALTLKEKKAGQRACDEKDAKGKLCVGHLKRWYTPTEEVVREIPELAKALEEARGQYSSPEKALLEVGRRFDLYRCERCHTLYRPTPADTSTAGRRFDARPVNILGDTLRPK